MPLPIYPTVSTSAFFERLQLDNDIVELIELDFPGGTTRKWVTSNQPMWYTLSGANTEYSPFLGGTRNGIEESADLGVSIIDFFMANTGSDIQGLLESEDFTLAGIKIGRVFASTPNLGRMQIYEGQVGDFVHNRTRINGQARNVWKSANINWPYGTYREKCVWRFGSSACGKNTSSLTIAPTGVVSFDGLTLVFSPGTLTNSYANGRFNFGRTTFTGGTNSGHLRVIRQHTGDMIAFSHPLASNVQAGLAVSIYPGCRKDLIADCRSLYDNDANFLGWPWILVQEDALR
jgi:uncharacterized phage protein (TIGR02218 family)